MSTAPRNSAGWTHACTPGQPAQPEDLVDVTALLEAYDAITPDVTDPAQKVVFAYPRAKDIAAPAWTARSTPHPHPGDRSPSTATAREHRPADRPGGRTLSAEPAWRTALEVLAGNDVQVGRLGRPAHPDAGRLTRDPEAEPGAAARADGIVVTPSHNPPRDGGFKYNPPHGGPADSDATGWIAGGRTS